MKNIEIIKNMNKQKNNIITTMSCVIFVFIYFYNISPKGRIRFAMIIIFTDVRSSFKERYKMYLLPALYFFFSLLFKM